MAEAAKRLVASRRDANRNAKPTFEQFLREDEEENRSIEIDDIEPLDGQDGSYLSQATERYPGVVRCDVLTDHDLELKSHRFSKPAFASPSPYFNRNVQNTNRNGSDTASGPEWSGDETDSEEEQRYKPTRRGVQRFRRSNARRIRTRNRNRRGGKNKRKRPRRAKSDSPLKSVAIVVKPFSASAPPRQHTSESDRNRHNDRNRHSGYLKKPSNSNDDRRTGRNRHATRRPSRSRSRGGLRSSPTKSHFSKSQSVRRSEASVPDDKSLSTRTSPTKSLSSTNKTTAVSSKTSAPPASVAPEAPKVEPAIDSKVAKYKVDVLLLGKLSGKSVKDLTAICLPEGPGPKVFRPDSTQVASIVKICNEIGDIPPVTPGSGKFISLKLFTQKFVEPALRCRQIKCESNASGAKQELAREMYQRFHILYNLSQAGLECFKTYGHLPAVIDAYLCTIPERLKMARMNRVAKAVQSKAMQTPNFSFDWNVYQPSGTRIHSVESIAAAIFGSSAVPRVLIEFELPCHISQQTCVDYFIQNHSEYVSSFLNFTF